MREVKFDDIPGIVIRPWERSGEVLSMDIAVSGPVKAAPGVDEAWAQLCRAQPRLHDGPILIVDHRELELGRLVVRRGSYKTLATAEMVRAKVLALGVQGLVVGHDQEGDACVLLGRRSSEVRMYPGMWENAPSGSVPPPGDGAAGVGVKHLEKVLRDEGLEEIGVDLGGSKLSCIALLEDRAARTIDVVLRVEVSDQVRSTMVGCRLQDCGAWEYSETAWSPITDACAWAERDVRGVSAPTRALLRWLALAGSGL